MTTHDTSLHNDNTYLLDGESAIEMARLLDQDKILTQSMGGIFPEYQDGELQEVSRILDVACGPGAWVLEVARTYPHIEVTGIDISKGAIGYAKAQAHLMRQSNAHFEVMNALKPLQFPDASFDLLNMRTVVAFVPSDQWPPFLLECKRVLRPGGTIRITEVEWGFTNKPSVERAMFEGAKILHEHNRSFSPNGYHLGITPVLRLLLRRAGFEHIQQKAHVIDSSYGMPAHEMSYQDNMLLFEQARSYWMHMTQQSEEAIDAFFAQALTEMQEEDYSAINYMLTAWGIKPEKA